MKPHYTVKHSWQRKFIDQKSFLDDLLFPDNKMPGITDNEHFCLNFQDKALTINLRQFFRYVRIISCKFGKPFCRLLGFYWQNLNMEQLVTSDLKLGIIAGGQLGKMLIQEASKWDIITYVLDKDENCPAGSISSHFMKGSNTDFDAV